MKRLELLAPAKDLACGKAAIDHGADAVYIGADRFGARAAAGNSVADIAELCAYAHQFGARVYVTVNTIVFDDELPATLQLLRQLQEAHVDAVLLQDMALLDLLRADPTFTFELHASTQTDNRTAAKVNWLIQQGFKRVVLARELSVDEIQEIHRQVPDAELEVFVHGALCVSYSGLCYASQHCFGRSANRGECAQFCRMKFDLVDADGREQIHQRHLLSLKDMNQLHHLQELAEAGAVSFKIEGRLKDVTYVKNVTAAYSRQLNELVRRFPDKYERASKGTCRYTFEPDLDKTFHRAYTTYFLHGRQPDIASFDTPKAMGEYVGYVKEIRGHTFNVAGTAVFANGDGLCFLNDDRQLEGFRVNSVTKGNHITPLKMPLSLRPGVRLYRNNSQEFERLLLKTSAERKLLIDMSFKRIDKGYELTAGDVCVVLKTAHQTAEKPQRENVIRQLTKLGGTPFECARLSLPDDFNDFIPSSQLADLRRKAVDALIEKIMTCNADGKKISVVSHQPHPGYAVPYLFNIANHRAMHFYEELRQPGIGWAYELGASRRSMIMQCRYCLRYALGHCVKYGGRPATWREPLSLRLSDGRMFPLEFDCKHCQMNVYA